MSKYHLYYYPIWDKTAQYCNIARHKSVLSLNQCLFVEASLRLIDPLDFKFYWRHDLASAINFSSKGIHSSNVHCLNNSMITFDKQQQGYTNILARVSYQILFDFVSWTEFKHQYIDLFHE